MLDASVVLPVHVGVDPVHLGRALDSMFAQSVKADEIIVVEDGPLSSEHLNLLSQCESRSSTLKRIRLQTNSGPGAANQAGVEAAGSSWIVKMDSDDISLPNRLELQMSMLNMYAVDVIGTAMSEFDGDEDHIVAVRRRPLTHEGIARRMRTNNPINHPTVIFRRSLALAVGGYSPEMRYMEDYDLFARMLQAGARMKNLPDPLVMFRGGEDLVRRRRARSLWLYEQEMQLRLHRYGLIGAPRMYANTALRFAVAKLPEHAIRAAYKLNLI